MPAIFDPDLLKELDYYKGVNQEQKQIIVTLQRKLDEREELLEAYQGLAMQMVTNLDAILKGVADART